MTPSPEHLAEARTLLSAMGPAWKECHAQAVATAFAARDDRIAELEIEARIASDFTDRLARLERVETAARSALDCLDTTNGRPRPPTRALDVLERILRTALAGQEREIEARTPSLPWIVFDRGDGTADVLPAMRDGSVLRGLPVGLACAIVAASADGSADALTAMRAEMADAGKHAGQMASRALEAESKIADLERELAWLRLIGAYPAARNDGASALTEVRPPRSGEKL